VLLILTVVLMTSLAFMKRRAGQQGVIETWFLVARRPA
jgi:hypothetical protein